MKSQIRTVEDLTMRCSVCKTIETLNGMQLSAPKQQHAAMDNIEAAFIKRGWQMSVRCPACATN